ncbi:MAG: hypothetical protein JKX94_04915 [Sneathiella sp.]|nr:hypothetical protein [Sneathiella sp.]
MAKQVWIGLFGLTIPEKNEVLEGCDYAYVNALSVAISKEEFISKVKLSCQKLQFLVDEIEDVEPFSQRIKNYKTNADMYQLAEQAKSKNEVMFGTFHGSEG